MLFQFLIYCCFFIIIVFCNSWVWKKILPGRLYALFLFPGIVVHELSHVVGCLLTGTKIKNIKLFSFKGGYVRHKRTGAIKTAIISFFPIVGSLVFLFFLMKLMIGVDSWQKIITEFEFGLRFWLFFYFSITVIICLLPSKKDFKNATVGFFLLVLIVLVLYPLFGQEFMRIFSALIDMLEIFSLFSLITLLFSVVGYLIKITFVKLLKLL